MLILFFVTLETIFFTDEKSERKPTTAMSKHTIRLYIDPKNGTDVKG